MTRGSRSPFSTQRQNKTIRPATTLSRAVILLLAESQGACSDPDAVPEGSKPLSELVRSVEALNLGPVIEVESDDNRYEMKIRGQDGKKAQVLGRSIERCNTASGFKRVIHVRMFYASSHFGRRTD
ncbi:MAG TPA: hypothetical protein VMP00_05815 [Burkholderiales bacterium]|nr:hypothetical protein [Burkholderiales bacterium]